MIENKINSPQNFAERISRAKKILVAHPAGLGDAIHTIPALTAIKRNSPNATLDLMVTAGSETLLSEVPGVEKIFTIQWHPRPANRSIIRRARINTFFGIWKTRYDAFIDLKPSDRTQLTAMLCGAPSRLALECMYWGLPRPWYYTDIVKKKWKNETTYKYILDGLKSAGFATDDILLTPQLLPNLRANTELRNLIHVSLCATSPSRELTLTSSKELISRLCIDFPQHRILVTGSKNPREKQIIDNCLSTISHPNLIKEVGTLSLIDLARHLAACDLHIGPDTGSLHLAWLCGAPTVSWFLNHETLSAWVPREGNHIVLVSAFEQSRQVDNLVGISVNNILDAAHKIIRKDFSRGGDTVKFILPNHPHLKIF